MSAKKCVHFALPVPEAPRSPNWVGGHLPLTPLVFLFLAGRISQKTYNRLTGENKILMCVHGGIHMSMNISKTVKQNLGIYVILD